MHQQCLTGCCLEHTILKVNISRQRSHADTAVGPLRGVQGGKKQHAACLKRTLLCPQLMSLLLLEVPGQLPLLLVDPFLHPIGLPGVAKPVQAAHCARAGTRRANAEPPCSPLAA